ncbi:PEP-CTERM sorting domain-containing protein [Roseateles sp. BYS180W]|uniref:PEP-CTERM sorting domain-containing protein n=1 Tax=Roseateles rivi TaxID=3299028 RepID=A0ABW7FUB1_9BURK
MNTSKRIFGLALLALASSPSWADGAWNCGTMNFSDGVASVPYSLCLGSFSPPPVTSVAQINALLGTAFTTLTKDDTVNGTGSTSDFIDAGSGPNGAGTITFLRSIDGPFALELKLGQEWSVYKFDNGASAGSTLSFTLPPGPHPGLGLSHVSLATSVPEPQSMALMLVGLLAVGGMARRRQPR